MGFEPTTGGFADPSWISILLVRLAFTTALLADFDPYWGPIVPNLFPVSWGGPLGRDNPRWAHLPSIEQFRALSPSGRWGLGKGNGLSRARLLSWPFHPVDRASPELQSDGEAAVCQRPAVDHSCWQLKLVRQWSNQRLLIRLPEPLSTHSSAMGTDIFCERPFEGARLP